ncbi:hypothetical protein KBC75_00775 [Candidatus Shapirobacteria bacterium]|nr:hypothetical protein [Candidatus Shapirobacteria bacterium]
MNQTTFNQTVNTIIDAFNSPDTPATSIRQNLTQALILNLCRIIGVNPDNQPLLLKLSQIKPEDLTDELKASLRQELMAVDFESAFSKAAQETIDDYLEVLKSTLTPQKFKEIQNLIVNINNGIT